MRTTPRRLIATIAVLGLLGPGVADAAQPGKYAGKLYVNGKEASTKGTKVTFKVVGKKVRNFRVAKGGVSSCVSLIGGLSFTFYPLSFEVPSARIRNGKIAAKYVVRDDGDKIATNYLKGRFNGKRITGTLEQEGPASCHAEYDWRARKTG